MESLSRPRGIFVRTSLQMLIADPTNFTNHTVCPGVNPFYQGGYCKNFWALPLGVVSEKKEKKENCLCATHELASIFSRARSEVEARGSRSPLEIETDLPALERSHFSSLRRSLYT